MVGYVSFLDSATGLIRSDLIQRSDGVLIPSDAGNDDWKSFQAWIAAGNKPTVPPLAVFQAAAVQRLYVACEATIAAGFSSAALGSARLYPMKLTDQQNRDSAYLDLLDALLTPTLVAFPSPATWLFWCQDPATSAWSRLAHTAAQVRQVRLDTRSALIAAQTKLAGLVAQVNAATSPAAVQAIGW